jgi:hypothetical protein
MEKRNLGGFYYWTIAYILACKFQTASSSYNETFHLDLSTFMRKVHHSNIANVIHGFRRLKGIISDQQGHFHLHVLVWRVVMELVEEGANLDVIRPREDWLSSPKPLTTSFY